MQTVVIENDFKIPGTSIILEKNDQINIIEKMKVVKPYTISEIYENISGKAIVIFRYSGLHKDAIAYIAVNNKKKEKGEEYWLNHSAEITPALISFLNDEFKNYKILDGTAWTWSVFSTKWIHRLENSVKSLKDFDKVDDIEIRKTTGNIVVKQSNTSFFVNRDNPLDLTELARSIFRDIEKESIHGRRILSSSDDFENNFILSSNEDAYTFGEVIGYYKTLMEGIFFLIEGISVDNDRFLRAISKISTGTFLVYRDSEAKYLEKGTVDYWNEQIKKLLKESTLGKKFSNSTTIDSVDLTTILHK